MQHLQLLTFYFNELGSALKNLLKHLKRRWAHISAICHTATERLNVLRIATIFGGAMRKIKSMQIIQNQF